MSALRLALIVLEAAAAIAVEVPRGLPVPARAEAASSAARAASGARAAMLAAEASQAAELDEEDEEDEEDEDKQLLRGAHSQPNVAPPPPGATGCSSWCSQAVHCSHSECILCPSCSAAQRCEPTTPSDLSHESCEKWCKEERKEEHCPTCACRQCSFCTAAQLSVEMKCTPTAKDDGKVKSCKSYCKDQHASTHCKRCDCQMCSICQAPGASPAADVLTPRSGPTIMCTSALRDDGKVESCKEYCSEKHASVHCARCDCKACGFCLAQRSCTPQSAADAAVEACESFCNDDHPQDHCPQCRCKRCSFCDGGGAGEEGRGDRPASASSCTPLDTNDVRVASCEPFCNAKQAGSHCLRCSCKTCTFCNARGAALGLLGAPPPPDPACATVSKRGSASAEGVVVAQVRLKVWEARSLIRITWPSDAGALALRVAKVDGAELMLTSGATLTFALGDEARAISVRGGKAFEVHLLGAADVLMQHLEQPLEIKCHYQLKACAGASWQLLEDWGGGYRAEVLIAEGWAAGAHVQLDFGSVAVRVDEMWQATALPDPSWPTRIDFVLDATADGDGGFGYTARGFPTPPSIKCTFEGRLPPRSLPASQALRARAQPPVPDAPVAVSTECGEFKLTWHPPPDAERAEWAIFYRAAEVSPAAPTGTFPTIPPAQGALTALATGLRPPLVGHTNFVHTISGLPAQTALRFFLRYAVSREGPWSALSGASQPVTSALGAPPAKPTGLTLPPLPIGSVAVSCDALMLTWAPSTGCAIVDYRLQVRVEGTAKWITSAALGADSTSFHGFGTGEVGPICREGSTIEMRLQAKNGAGWSAYSEALSVRLGTTQTPVHAQPPRAVSTPTCDALTLRWAAPEAHGTPLSNHRVEWASTLALREPSSAADAWQSVLVDGSKQEVRLDGLDGGVSYTIRVASQALLGWGTPSPPLLISTPASDNELDPPQPPTYLPPPSGRCDAIMLRLPAGRRGCEHEDHLALQVRSTISGSTWTTLQTVDVSVPSRRSSSTATPPARQPTSAAATAESASGHALLITSLDPYTGYEFRLIAQRGPHSSPASRSTALLLPGPAGDRLFEAPLVQATSSASYRVSWAKNAGTCRPGLSWDLLVTRAVAGHAMAPVTAPVTATAEVDSHGSVHLAGDGTRGGTSGGTSGDVRLVASSLRNVSTHDELGMRCPPPGCAFQLHATNLQGAQPNLQGAQPSFGWSALSAYVPTNAPPPLPPGWARLEARLDPSQPWSGNAAEFVKMLGTQRACAEQARCHPSKLSVREVYGQRYVIFDAFTMGGAVGLVPQPAADEAAVFAALSQAADQLTLVSELLVVPPPSALEGSTPLRVLFRRDPSAPGTEPTNPDCQCGARHFGPLASLPCV